MSTVDLMSPSQQHRGDLEVQRALALAKEIKTKEATTQGALREVTLQMGQLQVQVAKEMKASSLKKIEEADKLLATADSKRNHDLLVLALGKMIFDAVKQITKAPKKPADNAKEIAEDILNQFEGKNIHQFAVFSENRKCMKLTPGIASAIHALLPKLKDCTTIAFDLTKFQDQIDPQALQTVLACKPVTKYTFALSAKVSIDQIVQAAKKERPFEAVYV